MPCRPWLPATLRSSLTWLLVLLFTHGLAQGTVTDDLGRDVTLDVPATRIVSMIPTHTEKVCAIGACDRLVGVDMFSNYPTEVQTLPSLGSAFEADVEALVALDPDLVLTDEYSGLHDVLEPLGIAVYVGTPQTVAEVWEVTRDVATLLGLQDEAEALIRDAIARVDALSERVALGNAPSVFVELDPSPYSVGPQSYLGELLTLAGGANVVAAELGAFPLVDPEYIVAQDPDVLLLLDAPFGESADTVRVRPGWRALSAVAEGAIIEFTQPQVDLLNRAGPRLPEALELLIDVLEEYRR